MNSPLYVSAQALCASTSTLSGSFSKYDGQNDLFLSTAGVSSTFAVNLKDVYGNAVNNVDLVTTSILTRLIYDNISIEARFYSNSSASPLGNYIINTRPTTAGFCSLHAGVAYIGGLFATYYSGEIEENIPERISIDSSIDFSGFGTNAAWPMLATNALCSCAIGDCCRAAFSVRWAGLLQTQAPTVNTFSAKISSTDDRVRLWIDNLLLIDQWNSLAAPNIPFTYIFRTNHSVAVKVEYKQYNSGRGISIFSNRSEGSFLKFAFYELGLIKQVNILPSSLCASSSIVSGAISLATCSSPAVIYIQSKDVFGNSLVLTGSPSIIVRLVNNIGSGRSIVGESLSLSSWSYFLTVSGSYSLAISVPLQLGIAATYYGLTNFTNPVISRADNALQIFSNSPINGVNAASIRWLGFLQTSGSSLYTFQLLVQGINSRVRLWVDNALTIDQWNSLSTTSPSSNIFLDSTQGLVDIMVEYKVDALVGSWIELKWQHLGCDLETLPIKNLFVRADFQGSPFQVYSAPAPVGRGSFALGAALTLTTAGVSSIFTVFLRDDFGASCGNSASPLIVACNATAFTGGGFSRTYHLIPGLGGLLASSTNIFTNGTCIISYNIHSSGVFVLNIGVFKRGGLMGMVYLDKYFVGALLGTRIDTVLNLDFKTFNDLAPLPAMSRSAVGQQVIATRWLGMIQPQFNELYWIIVEVSDFAKLGVWINNAVVLSAVSNDPTPQRHLASVPSSPGAIFDIAIEYLHYRGAGTIQLRWSSMNTPETVIPSSQLWFAAVSISSAPTLLLARAGSGYCVTLSTILGSGISVASVGITSSFAIVVR